MADSPCAHLDRIAVQPPPLNEVDGCEECLKTGSSWVHLRICLSCGKVGCCDSSPNRHASAHALDSGHPIIRSMEPGEDWSYCFVDDVAFLVDIEPSP